MAWNRSPGPLSPGRPFVTAWPAITCDKTHRCALNHEGSVTGHTAATPPPRTTEAASVCP
ncbi:hypothetical protein E2C01_034460 [Portunus trituberculatus]|uniref:Uncharacterized protein n=1 Tax=Portunus trituberculatus TaxID=210409 RepID=A0A5B7F6B3_PORTR|nr:hypothetical protein [Portunus trituberculatus]